MSNIKTLCKQHRNDPKECLTQLRALEPTRTIAGQWAFYAASIGYYEVFRACWSSVESTLQSHDEEYNKSGLLMNACVGGDPHIVECVARAYAKEIPNAYKMVEHCAKSGKKDVLDVLLKVGSEVGVYSWSFDRIIKECFKAHQNTIAMAYLTIYKDDIQSCSDWAKKCCIMGNTEGLILLDKFCKANPSIKFSYTWKSAMEEASKNQRIEMLKFLLKDGATVFNEKTHTETYFDGVLTAAHWARNVSFSNPQTSEEMLHMIFKMVPFEMWKHKVGRPLLEGMEQRYAQYLRDTIQTNIDDLDRTHEQISRRKI